jgi:hypothetical protein
LVYAVIVGLWAVVLIPMWLRRHEAATESRSVDRFSQAMRILSRREATISTRTVVMPARSAESRRPVASGGSARPTTARRRDPSTVARVAMARRRRRTFTLLVLTSVLLAVPAALGRLTWWPSAVAVILLAAFVVHLRLQARRAALLRSVRTARADETVAPRADAAPSNVWRPVDSAPAEAHFSASVDVQRNVPSAAVSDPTVVSWEPLDMPLPTYVTAPKAVRPVRVIDLTVPGAWTSSSLLDDDPTLDLAMMEAEHEQETLDGIIAPKRAVGD